MRLPESDLFLLIKSLSKREKANFVQYCKSSGKSENFLPLFYAFNSQEEYEEQKIRVEFHGNSFLNNFSQTKKNLSTAIIRSFRQVGNTRNESIYAQLEDTIQYFNRGIYHSARRQVSALKERAQNSEDFHIWEKCLEMERQIALKTLPLSSYLENAEKIDMEMVGISKMVSSFSELRRVREQSFNPLKKKIMARGRGDLEKLNALTEIRQYSGQKLESNRAKREYLTLSANLEAFQRNVKSAFSLNLELVSLYENNPFLLEEFFEEYVDRKTFVLAFSLELGQRERALEVFDNLKITKAKYPYQKLFLADRINLISLIIDLASEEEYLHEVQLSQIGKFASKSNLPHLRKIQYYYWLAVIYLKKGDFQESKRWSIQIVNTDWGEVLVDFQCMARIILLIAIFALGNSDLLEIFHRPSQRFLRKRKELQKFEKTVLAFVKKEIGFFPEKLKDLVAKILKDVSPLELERATHYFDLISWANSIIAKNDQELTSM